MTTTTMPTTEPVAARKPTRTPARRIVLHAFLWFVALSWLFPLAWAVLNSFRDYAYTAINGYVSFGGFTIQNYVNAWNQGDFGLHFWNSAVITVPAVVLTLFLASCMAFVLARFSFRFNLTLLRVPRRQPAAAAGAAGAVYRLSARSSCRTGCPARGRCSTTRSASS